MGSFESPNMLNLRHDVEPSGSRDRFKTHQSVPREIRRHEAGDDSARPCPTCGHENSAALPDSAAEIRDASGHRHGYDTPDEYQCDLDRECE